MSSIGKHSFLLESKPRIIASCAYVGEKEGKGPLGKEFDCVVKDDTLGLGSWEQAESRMFESAVRASLQRIKRTPEDLSMLIGGDLLNQIISAGFAARELKAPFIGLYSACSTISESLMLGGMLINGGFASLTACCASSHYSSVERQYRYPLEMGVQPVPTSQRTVTGAGCMLLGRPELFENDIELMYRHIAVTGGTVGTVADYGITDANNMGAAMAPAAAKTIMEHFRDTCTNAGAFDRIITGDLGRFGTQLLYELLDEKGMDIQSVHEDCGKLIFGEEQGAVCGGSGCGCSAVVMSSHFLPMIECGELKKVLFLATGALLSPVSSMQGESIPSIAHAVVIEHV